MNSIVDPKDPDYCETCGGECVAGCKAAPPDVKTIITVGGLQRRAWDSAVEWVLPLPNGELVIRRTGPIQWEGWHTLTGVGSSPMPASSARAVFEALELQFVE